MGWTLTLVGGGVQRILYCRVAQYQGAGQDLGRQCEVTSDI